MTISESKLSEIEVGNTSGSVLTTTALSLMLLMANYGPIQKPDEWIILSKTEGTVSEPLSLQISAGDVFSQLNRVYGDLLRDQVELDLESKKVLYANLWDLYT
jgi:hypothetical protein